MDESFRATVDPDNRAILLRNMISYKHGNSILAVDFSNEAAQLQAKDTSKAIELMEVVSQGKQTGHYLFRTKINIKEIDPLAAKAYGNDKYVDIEKMTDAEIENMLKHHYFDFPLWFKKTPGFDMKKVRDYNAPFIIQAAGCNFHDGSAQGGCWYCFVDDVSNCGKTGHLLSVDDTIESMAVAQKKINDAYKQLDPKYDINMRVLRVSGGEPTLVLDWILDLWKKIGEKGYNWFGQIDTNLSTGHMIEHFESTGQFQKHTLEQLAQYPIKVLTAIKGVSEENLQENVQAKATTFEQMHSLKKFVKAGFDIYPQMYNPNPKELDAWLTRIDSEIENFSLRVHIGPLKMYGPTRKRLELEAKRLGEKTNDFIAAKVKSWEENFTNSCEVLDKYLVKTYNVRYKDTTRSDVEIKLK
jgi:pyruvate-formate lyase-activating enzyme